MRERLMTSHGIYLEAPNDIMELIVVQLSNVDRLLRGAEDASKDPDYAHTDARAVETGQAAAFIAPLISLSSPSHGNALPVGSREAAITPSLLIRCPSGLCASGSCEWSSHVLPGSPINGSMEVHSCPEEMQ